MDIRTLLVDSDYLLKRSFFGAKDVYTKSFGHLGGLYQFLTTIRKLIKEHKINKVVLVFDGEGGGLYRHWIDEEYKANRINKEWHKKIQMTQKEIEFEEEKQQSILKQRMRIKAYAEELFLRIIEIDNIEADDIIAYYCLNFHEKENILLFTNDRDFLQLLNLNINILFSNISQPVNKTNYMMYFNHYYQNALTIKIIKGDISDNIKGIDGIGEEILLKYFPELKYKYVSVKEICAKANQINNDRVLKKKKPLKIFEKLLSNIERLKTNYKLIDLRNPFLNDIDYEILSDIDAPLLPTERSSRILYEMMIEDDFLSVYGSTFVNYVEPFYTVIVNEKKTYENYLRESKFLVK